MGLSSELRASIYIGNQSVLEEHVTPAVAAYSSHHLELKDMTDDVELVKDGVLKGHQNPDELALSHEAESFTSHGISFILRRDHSLLLVLFSLAMLSMGYRL